MTYQAFGGGLDQPLDYWPAAACRAFQTNQSNFDFGPTITGEFSAAINDVRSNYPVMNP